ncbi:MAG: hypothetical protein WCL44_09800 [bacterium]
MAALKLKEIDAAAAAAKIEAPVSGITMPVEAAASSHSETDVAVNTMALLVYNTFNSYWMSASDFESTIHDRFHVIDAVFAKQEEIRFTISHSSLMINGTLADMENRYLKFLTEHLTRMDISNFTITRGMTKEEFKGLIGLLGKSQASVAQLGGFASAVSSLGFKNVQARKIVLKEINEDELVVARDQVDTGAIERRKQAESSALAYLSNNQAEMTEESVECLREVSRVPKKLAEVIAKAAYCRAGAATPENKDERRQIVVDLLERFFDGLMRHPSTRSRTGKKSVEKTLEELKDELLAAIKAQPEDEVTKAVESAVERMVEGLRIAGVAVDYSKKLKALEESERRILRFIKAQGLEKLKQAEKEEQLGDSGLDVSGWERLLAKSSIADKIGPVPESITANMEQSSAAIANLAAILDRLEGDIDKSKNDPGATNTEQLAGDLKDVSDKMAAMVEGTERKIHTLVDAVSADISKVELNGKLAEVEDGPHKLTRKQMVVMLAEIVQEICQPLAVIRCSIEMLRITRLGEVSQAQKNMLDLAHHGIERIGTLARSLKRISGMPAGLEPDRGITDQFYVKK